MVGNAEDDDSDIESNDAVRQQREALRKKKESIALHLQMLVHTVNCEGPCTHPLCARIKVRMHVPQQARWRGSMWRSDTLSLPAAFRTASSGGFVCVCVCVWRPPHPQAMVVHYTKTCKIRSHGGCPDCVRFLYMVHYHARTCKIVPFGNCNVPRCADMRVRASASLSCLPRVCRDDGAPASLWTLLLGRDRFLACPRRLSLFYLCAPRPFFSRSVCACTCRRPPGATVPWSSKSSRRWTNAGGRTPCVQRRVTPPPPTETTRVARAVEVAEAAAQWCLRRQMAAPMGAVLFPGTRPHHGCRTCTRGVVGVVALALRALVETALVPALGAGVVAARALPWWTCRRH